MDCAFFRHVCKLSKSRRSLKILSVTVSLRATSRSGSDSDDWLPLDSVEEASRRQTAQKHPACGQRWRMRRLNGMNPFKLPCF